ncbi:MAG TPA: flagellar basal body L-ring protein FlgH [Gammaproteobacteria bacterium]|nr:flagellar basal body L-ring protein FlgH [Gammaproteobacteria bacterium]
MTPRTVIWMSLSGLVLLQLTGCVTTPAPQDPAYVPAEPVQSAMPVYRNGSLYQGASNIGLFRDRVAFRRGDILTVLLVEDTNANKKAETTTSKDNSVGIDNATVLGYALPSSSKSKFTLGSTLKSANSFSGKGESKQSNTLTGTVTVVVDDVLANGNLMIRGQKYLAVNQGAEFVRISGIVRPEDITPDNQVKSTLVADAHIEYRGAGTVADSNIMGWLSRFFNSKWWLF